MASVYLKSEQPIFKMDNENIAIEQIDCSDHKSNISILTFIYYPKPVEPNLYFRNGKKRSIESLTLQLTFFFFVFLLTRCNNACEIISNSATPIQILGLK